jgi:protein TonB
MEHALRVRAASFAAAAGVCALAGFAVLSARFVYHAMEQIEGTAIETIVEEDPPRPPPPDPVRDPVRPQQPIAQDALALDDLDLPPIAAEFDVTLDTAPYDFGAGAGTTLVTDPVWQRRPADLERYYPSRALRRGMEGQARVECVVNVEGWLTNCVVLSETPANWGFGEAAARIARDHRMNPAMRDGIPVEARYRMTVPFDLQ